MLSSLNSGVSGMRQFQSQMDVIGNNIANVNTTGYKASRIEFEDTFSQTLQASAGGSGSTGTMPAMQIGNGVNVASITNNFSRGVVSNSGVPTDMAINGDGFFVVKDPVGGQTFVTRAGDFQRNHSGYLTNSDGVRLQGYNDSALSTIGDIQINVPASAGTGVTVDSWAVDSEGKIDVTLSDNTTFVGGQVLLQRFSSPQGLMKEGGNLYSGMANAGPLATPVAPSLTGPGTIQSGALEASNVDLTSEMTNLITTQRAFQANAKIITTSDEMLQDVINLKR